MNNEHGHVDNDISPVTPAPETPSPQEPVDSFVFTPEPRAVQAGEGVEWISQAWALVKEKLGMWILINVVFFLIIFAMAFLPLVSMFVSFVTPVFVGGIIAICENQRKTGEADIGLLFSGFQKKFGELFAIGAINFAANMVGMLIAFLIAGSAIFSLLMQADQYDGISDAALFASTGTFVFAGIVMALASLFGTALTWFAPALIMNHDFKIGTSISASLQAVKKNLLPGFLFFLIAMVLMFVSIIPFGLGLFISMPIMYATYYSTYRSIFFTDTKQSQTSSLIM
ncbi:BPSS1780 family membrane protein [Providencia alcalifaciens]|uniref:BPSS1780 family membrane protein n=1 Tax=Providencia alcalifaciens TaxID=126385 RepID=UPI001CC81AFA|nr:BPSS1780 family membrane protein [Providencia alcalifaciens]CAG9414555.1 hypothetical protein NVI2019_GHJFPKLH_01146 [Providencia alcalifaciens]